MYVYIYIYIIYIYIYIYIQGSTEIKEIKINYQNSSIKKRMDIK